MRYGIRGHREIEWELTVEADTETQAKAIARAAIEEASSPPGLVSFWDNEGPLTLLVVGGDFEINTEAVNQ